MSKSTDKISRRRVMAIPTHINKRGMSIGEVAKLYDVSWQAVWYWIGRLRAEGFKVNTREKGQTKMRIQ